MSTQSSGTQYDRRGKELYICMICEDVARKDEILRQVMSTVESKGGIIEVVYNRSMAFAYAFPSNGVNPLNQYEGDFARQIEVWKGGGGVSEQTNPRASQGQE